jgi:O-antigen/teichoic acid export membrane protein
MDEGEAEELFSSFVAIGQGSLYHIGGRLLGKAVGLAVNVLLTRTYGAALYGAFILATRVTQIGVVLSMFGAGGALSRFLPGFEDRGDASGFLGSVGGLSLLLGGVLSAGFYLAAPLVSDLTVGTEAFTSVLRAFALVIPVNGLANVATQALRGFELPGRYIGVDQGVWPILRLVFVGAAVLAGASIVGVVVATVLAWGATLVVAVALLVRAGVRPSLSRRAFDLREYLDFSGPVTVSNLAGLAYSQADVIVLGYLVADSTQVGIYAAAAAVSGLLALPAVGMNQLLPPVLSRLYESGQRGVMVEIYKLVARVAFTVSAFGAVMMIAYAAPLLSIFGPEFTGGVEFLFVLIAGRLSIAVLGYGDKMLLMTDHQYLHTAVKLASGAFSVVATFGLVVVLGPIGAALGFAATMLVTGAAETYLAWRTESVSPLSTWLLVPLLAGGLSLGCTVGLRTVLGRGPGVAGVIVSGVVFFGVVLGVGLREDDRRLYRHLLSSVREQLRSV